MADSKIYSVKTMYFPSEVRQRIEKIIDGLENFSEKIQIKPKEVADASQMNLIGNYFAMNKNFEKAIKYYDYALEIEPNNMWSWNNKALALLYSNKPDKALETLDEAINKKIFSEEKLFDQYYNRAIMLNALRKYREAALSYEEALELEPDSIDALNNFANVLAELGYYDDAIEKMQKAVKLKPHLLSLHMNLQRLKRKKDEDGIVRHFEQTGTFPWEKKETKPLSPEEAQKISTFILILQVDLGSEMGVISKAKEILDEYEIKSEIQEVFSGDNSWNVLIRNRGQLGKLKDVKNKIISIDHVSRYMILAEFYEWYRPK